MVKVNKVSGFFNAVHYLSWIRIVGILLSRIHHKVYHRLTLKNLSKKISNLLCASRDHFSNLCLIRFAPTSCFIFSLTRTKGDDLNFYACDQGEQQSLTSPWQFSFPNEKENLSFYFSDWFCLWSNIKLTHWLRFYLATRIFVSDVNHLTGPKIWPRIL